jgi:hypothetical protein
VIVAGAAGVLFAVSGGLRRGRARAKQVRDSGPEARPVPGSPAPTKALKPAKSPAKSKAADDDDLGEVADILRRHGIH